jgi:hypothetical protein
MFCPMENRKGKMEKGRNFSRRWFVVLFSIFWFPFSTMAQEPEVELVANLAAGRVVICVAKDGIVIAATENRIEAEARVPVVLPLSGKRVAVVLGAVEWVAPTSGADPVRLDEELRKAMGQVAGPKRLQQEQENDIEALGTTFLEPLRSVIGRLHRKVEVDAEEAVVEVLLIGYVENYGPEVWSLRYRIVQEPLRGDYWQTRVLRPAYDQLYPPEKGQPRTLMEVRYPPEDAGPRLVELLREDPRFERLRGGDPQSARSTQSVLAGESHKARVDDVLTLVRTALGVVTAQEQTQVIAVINERTGFDWILAPPERPKTEQEKRPPGAPTLRRPPQ